MSGHHPFSELTKNFTAERRQRIDEKRMKLNAVMKIYETRQSVSTIRKVWEKWLRNTEKPSFESYPYRLMSMQGSAITYVIAVISLLQTCHWQVSIGQP